MGLFSIVLFATLSHLTMCSGCSDHRSATWWEGRDRVQAGSRLRKELYRPCACMSCIFVVFFFRAGNVYEWSTLKLVRHIVEDGKRNSNIVATIPTHERETRFQRLSEHGRCYQSDLNTSTRQNPTNNASDRVKQNKISKSTREETSEVFSR